ncbi:hypothetical protein [Mucilaginibacter jinjuensis]|uniref:Uncharacterized protein n=1 Tax=Mucilaginibacter jinjuensis TaxID=1176721 RepID=A0ABY7T6I5_9SPHI|nr:hypothetical protein [Mucilaginibacter jinjuensis]WCT12095.1 hypothetical protein PQO05_25540 [Mucilaginibacter jinjuensis]
MKKPIISALALGLLPLFFMTSSYAQKASADSTASSYVESYIVSNYNKAVGEQSRLYNGIEYTAYSPLIKSNANFHDLKDLVAGTVMFDGYTFTKVPMLYDLNKDLLVVQLYNKVSNYILASDRVSSFDIDGQHFVYISADTVNNKTFSSGFYGQFYSGKTEATARYSKSIQNLTSGNDIETYFTTTKKQFYIKRGADYEAVSSEGDILKLLKDHKKELQQYIKANDLNFKKAPEKSIAAITSYYDHLNH